jgi:hypothetical protein
MPLRLCDLESNEKVKLPEIGRRVFGALSRLRNERESSAGTPLKGGPDGENSTYADGVRVIPFFARTGDHWSRMTDIQEQLIILKSLAH